ncbi:MAG: BMP family ABC transporter substrate-binding protein [Oscillospiraceae bacterium]|nr:BMP family ABC transporter substrate-binding protein [Oscillospiraceae bacterium]
MKKYIAVLLALVMVLGLAACGGSKPAEETKPAETKPAEAAAPAAQTETAQTAQTETPAEPAALTADDIDDNMTSADGTYVIAFVTDVGQLKDKSFNQGTWEGVKLYAYENGLSYKYYQPANGDQATDDDRYDAMKAAAEGGAQVIVCAGFMQGTALAKAAAEFTDVKFVFIDGWSLGMDNVVGIDFQEEQCGYLAGYAAVMEGYTELGFCGGGGGTNAAVNRYGYGYVQGAEAAAAEKGVDVHMNYTFLYGASFQASPELQTLTNGWYETGTEVIFSCGGSIFDSITAAASANDAAVIGVDVDQSFSSDTVITSALKGIGEAAYQALTAAFDGSWETFANGGHVTLGAKQGAVGLPTATWSLENWSVEEYEAMFAKIVSGEITIDNDPANLASTAHVTLNVVE